MFRISKDSPAHCLTFVAQDRSPILRTTELKNIAYSALDEARCFAGFLLIRTQNSEPSSVLSTTNQQPNPIYGRTSQ
ncbi:hypothetical protein BH18ACI4_BH18ACI4_21140 [soil metagenome]